MTSEQNHALALIERYGEGFSSLICGHDSVCSSDQQQSDFFALLLKASSNLRDVTEHIMQSIVRDVGATEDEWDPDDRVTDLLLKMQHQIKQVYQRLDERMAIYHQRGEYPYSTAAVAKHNLLECFDFIKETRTFILEHDADASGYDSFDSLDALLVHVNTGR